MPAVATAGGLPTRLGKYEILTPLAAGGMARIYIARTTGIGSFERHVVLKLITPERANDITAVQMFLDEARLAASLNHQNVAQVFEVGEDAGIHYLAMEYVHGQDLRALLAKAGSQGTRVPLELALTVVAGAAAGLHHAHERRGPDGVSLGIVHRDVSPSNIMVGYDGAVKLLDFGIAKATMRSVETQSGIIKGKFAYMAPEQCRGRDVDRRSDVFSLGIILYEISTQHRCFRADSDFDTMHRIVTGDVVRPTRLIHGYPQALEAIVMKALAVDASQRYQSAHQLLEALESFAVSARMSLSTMALGRFMREMFGEQPEPWLTQQRAAVVPQKESTVSNTNNSGSEREIHRAPTNLTGPREAIPVAASTLLDLPRTAPDTLNDSGPNQSFVATQVMPPEQVLAEHRVTGSQPLPVVPHGTNPLAGQFVAAPGSGSGPAIASTRHGYGANELSYPRYEAPPPDPALQLKPNRRPVFIGLGVVVIGLAVGLAMMIGKSGKDVTAADHGVGSDAAVVASAKPTVPAVVAPAVDAAPPVVVEESSIKIKIVSDPPGADVLLAGKVIGTTPLERELEKRDGQAILVVHRSGYVDVETKIDLTADFEKTLTLAKLEPKVEATPPEPTEPPRQKPATPKVVRKEPVAKTTPKVTAPKDTPKVTAPKDPPKVTVPKDAPKAKEPKDDAKEPAAPKKLEGCQPQGQYDPFNDPRPVCK